MPDATGLELLAQELARCAGRRASSAPSHAHGQATIEIEPGSDPARRLPRLRERGYGFLASVHGVDYYPDEPRLGVLYELLDMKALDRLTVKLRVPLDDAARRVGHARTGRPPTTRSARSTTCSASSSTATRTCAGS